MNALEKWFMRRIIRREVSTRHRRDEQHQALYQMIRDEHRAQFTEDNAVTADDYLREHFEKTQSQTLFETLRK